MRLLKLLIPLTIVIGLAYYFVIGRHKVNYSSNESMAKAAIAAETWLSVVDSRRWVDSWSTSSQFFKKTVSKGRWSKAIQGARDPYGELQTRRVVSKKYRNRLKGAPEGHYVVIKFRSNFSKRKKSVETVTTKLDQDDKWRVAGYFIR